MKVISVVSAKGGVGKSTFCMGVGKILASMGKRVLLMDMDIGVRSLDILLGVWEQTVYNWGDAVRGNCDYKKAVAKINPNLYLLASPIDFSEEYTVDNLKNLISKYERDFDYIILDSPAGLESGFKLCLGVSNACVVMSTPDSVSIRAASYACKAVREKGIADVRLVVNNFNRKLHKKINVDHIIDTVGARLLGIVPLSEGIFSSVNGGGIPENCMGYEAFYRIAQRIEGKNVPFKGKYV